MTRQIVTEVVGDASKFNQTLDQAGAKAGGFGAKLDAVNKSKGFQAVTQGVGMGAGIGAYNLLSKGISTVTDFMQDAAAAAKEDEANVSHLTTALEANVPGWKSSSAAIEATIEAGQKLAFTDDDIRDSLAALVPVTHNVSAAISQQKVAMNLARFGHMSLVDATNLLIKSDVGSTKALKALGIQVTSTMSAQDRLNAVNAIANDQADKYITTQQGRADAEKVRLDEIKESFGRDFVAPIQDGVMEMTVGSLHFLEDLNDGIQHAFGNMSTSEIKAHQAMLDTYSDFEDLRGVVMDTTPVVTAFGDTAQAAAVATGVTYDQLAADFHNNMQSMSGDMQLTKDSIKSDIEDLTEYTKDRLTNKQIRDILAGKGSLGRQLEAGMKSSDPDIVQAATAIRDHLVEILSARVGVTVTVSKRSKDNDKGKGAGGPANPPSTPPPSGGGGGGGGGGAPGHGVNVVVNGHIFGLSGVDELTDKIAQNLRMIS